MDANSRINFSASRVQFSPPALRHVYACIFVLLSVAGCATSPPNPAYNTEVTPLQSAVGQPSKADGYKPHAADLQKVKELLAAGANINEINIWGSALHSAAKYANPEIVGYLITHGADINMKSNGVETPLITAAQAGKTDIVKLLVARGADVNAVADFVGWTPLSEAAYSGRYEIVTYLISKGADARNQASTAYVRAAAGMGLFMKEAAQGAKAVKGAQKDQKAYEYIAILDLLVLKGANINAVDSSGQNALHQSAMYANPQVTRYFLKAGVNPNVSSAYMGTPLDTAQKTKESYQNMLQSRPAGISNEAWVTVSKHIRDISIPGFNAVIAILAPLTHTGAAGAAARPVAAAANTARADTASNAPEPTLTDTVVDTVADCVKLKAALSACDKMAWPLSTGCSSLAKSQYSNVVCRN